MTNFPKKVETSEPPQPERKVIDVDRLRRQKVRHDEP